MNVNEAVSFLKGYQPMPSDEDLVTQGEVLKKYEEVRLFFLNNPDPVCIPLFLHSFGEGDGLGVYQLVEENLVLFSKDEVLPHLISALGSPFKSVRYWCSQISEFFPDLQLISLLLKIAESDGFDSRYASIVALSQISNPVVKEKLLIIKENEKDEELIELIEDILFQ
ncbi:HEAT repeat domain-containing protein [Actinomycetes bacterium NPDC127524]